MISSIIKDKLFIGTIHDAIHDHTDWGLIICVAEWDNLTDNERNDLMIQCRTILHAPFMRYEQFDNEKGVWNSWAEEEILDHVANTIEMAIETGMTPILVHCAAGVERSPLAVMWYLHKKEQMSLEAAYEFVKFHRPIVENRLSWIKERNVLGD